VHSPKHTVGEQLLDVRRDKRERAAFAAINESGMRQETPQEDDENDDDDEEEYRISFDGNAKCR
jgi:hypothetical protein